MAFQIGAMGRVGQQHLEGGERSGCHRVQAGGRDSPSRYTGEFQVPSARRCPSLQHRSAPTAPLLAPGCTRLPARRSSNARLACRCSTSFTQKLMRPVSAVVLCSLPSISWAASPPSASPRSEPHGPATSRTRHPGGQKRAGHIVPTRLYGARGALSQSSVAGGMVRAHCGRVAQRENGLPIHQERRCLVQVP